MDEGGMRAVRRSVDRQGVGGGASESTVERGKQLREQKNGKQLRNCCNSSKLPPNQAPSPRYSRTAIGFSPANSPGNNATQSRSHGSSVLLLFLCRTRLVLSSANSEIKSERNKIRGIEDAEMSARILSL